MAKVIRGRDIFLPWINFTRDNQLIWGQGKGSFLVEVNIVIARGKWLADVTNKNGDFPIIFQLHKLPLVYLWVQ